MPEILMNTVFWVEIHPLKLLRIYKSSLHNYFFLDGLVFLSN